MGSRKTRPNCDATFQALRPEEQRTLEPRPVYEIYTHDVKDLIALWESLSFVDLIAFGRWNNDARARTDQAQAEYAAAVKLLKGFYVDHDIQRRVSDLTCRLIMRGRSG